MTERGGGAPDGAGAHGAGARGDGRIALALLVAFQGAFLLAASGRGRSIDEYSFFAMTDSLAREGTLAVPQMAGAGHFYGRLGRDGRPYAPYGFGQAVLAVPYDLAAGSLLERATPARNADLARAAGISISGTTLAALAVAMTFLLARRAGAGARPAIATAILLGVSTPLAVYAKQAFAEPLLAALAAGAMLSLARGLERRSAVFLAIASALAGWAFATRFVPGALLALSLAAGFALERRGRPRLAEAVAGVLPFALIAGAQLALNAARFGDPLQFGYPDEAEGGKALNRLSAPGVRGIYGLLLSPGKGLLVFAPILLCSLAGFRRLLARLPGAAIAAGAFAASSLLVYAGYAQWEGGYCFGPRYLAPALPGLVVPLALALESRGRAFARIAGFLAAAGIAVQAVGASTSFLEDQAGTGRYYDARYDYRLDYSLASQAGLLGHYLATVPTVRAFQEPLGLGFDFWWVFLRKAGTASAALLAWGAAGLALLVWGARALRRAWGAPPGGAAAGGEGPGGGPRAGTPA